MKLSKLFPFTSTLFVVLSFAETHNNFHACSGLYDVISSNTEKITQVFVTDTSLTYLNNSKPTFHLELEEYNYNEEGNYNTAYFNSTENTCSWTRSSNYGKKTHYLKFINNDLIEYTHSCSWEWSCNFESKLILKKVRL